MDHNTVERHLKIWFSRKTTSSGIRRVGELPFAIGSDIGVQRKENQDRVAVLIGDAFTVAALCDGMGGMVDGGACASQALASFFSACVRLKDLEPAARLMRAAEDANRAVHTVHGGRGGSTLSAVLYDGKGGTVGINIGDSRIYAYQDGRLEQLTVDDTVSGLLPNKEDNSEHRNQLLQYIGMGEGVEPHIIKIPEVSDSVFLTCDGVHFINKETINLLIQAAKDPAVAAKRLIEIAKWCGGPDNASVVALKPLSVQVPFVHEAGVIQVWDPFGELQLVELDVCKSGGAVKGGDEVNLPIQKAPKRVLHPTHLPKRRKTTDKKTTGEVTANIGAEEMTPTEPSIYFNCDVKDHRHD